MKGLKNMYIKHIHIVAGPSSKGLHTRRNVARRWHTQSAHTGGIILYACVCVCVWVGKGKIGRRTNAKALALATE